MSSYFHDWDVLLRVSCTIGGYYIEVTNSAIVRELSFTILLWTVMFVSLFRRVAHLWYTKIFGSHDDWIQ